MNLAGQRTRRFWYEAPNALTRARDLCYSIGMRPPRGRSLQVPEWAEVIGRLVGGGHARKPGAKAQLRRAALVLMRAPEAAAAVCSADRLGGSLAALRAVIAVADPPRSAEQEELDRLAEREQARKRRADYARRMLAEHKTKLAREERLVKKWAAKVRRYEKEGF